MHYYVGKSHVIPMKWEQVEQLKTTTRGENPASKKANAGAYDSVSDVSVPNLSSFFKNFDSNTLRSGGGDGDRTHDPELAKLVLSQLSYAPAVSCDVTE